MMTTMAILLGLGAASSVAAWPSSCPDYEAVSTPEAQHLDPDIYVQGFWYEIYSANVFLTKGCECAYSRRAHQRLCLIVHKI